MLKSNENLNFLNFLYDVKQRKILIVFFKIFIKKFLKIKKVKLRKRLCNY
jgi:hypothetical protein